MRYEKLNVNELTVNWCSLQSGGPIGIGNVWWVDGTNGSNGNSGKSANSALKTIEAAESAMVASQNDKLNVLPASYNLTAELDWDKDFTRVVGQSASPIAGLDHWDRNIAIYTETAAVPYPLDVSGANCAFMNITFVNNGNDAGNLAALRANGYNCYYGNCAFFGVATAGVDDVEAAAALYCLNASNNLFEGCTIGQSTMDAREAANSGVLRYTGSIADGSPSHTGKFKGCRFLSQSVTQTVAMVALPGNFCLDGVWEFDDCLFFNKYVDWGASLNQVFYDNCGTTHAVVLHKCRAVGFSEWQTADRGLWFITSDMPEPGNTGGICAQPND